MVSRILGFFRKYAIKDFPEGGFDFFLIDRQVVNELNKNQDIFNNFTDSSKESPTD